MQQPVACLSGGGLTIVLALSPMIWGCARTSSPSGPGSPNDAAVVRIEAGRQQGESLEDEVKGTEVHAWPTPEAFGLLRNEAGTSDGYTLFAPLFFSTTTYLIDMEGRVVQTWESDCPPGQVAYLLENGHLLRAGMAEPQNRDVPPAGGAGGRVQEYTWDGELVWDYEFPGDQGLPHHDIERLPNGNILLIVWDRKSAQQATAAGRDPRLQAGGDLRPDFLAEVKPTGKATGQIVWQWNVWDHLIQDYDPSRPNYGNVAAHPELIDINHAEGWADQLSSKELNKLRSLGYLGSSSGRQRGPITPDWTHINSVAYNAERDQILLSVLGFNEIWVIDHSTTMAEAAAHSGGRSGKGGDLLYRWGNPQAYRTGTFLDQRLFAQHYAQWIPRGLPGAGNILLFNNGRHRPNGNYSSVDEIVPPVNGQGQYHRDEGIPFGPDQPIWSYTAPAKADFYSSFVSSAHRLRNGNTLICSGESGTIFEVTPEKSVVWKYRNPIAGRPGPGGEVFGRPWWSSIGSGPRLNSVFHACRYTSDFPGLAGKDLTPGKTIEELQSLEAVGPAE